jgi:membrane dipeptidase
MLHPYIYSRVTIKYTFSDSLFLIEKMPILIDSHQDIAYNILNFGRDYRRSAAETRLLEKDTPIPERNGQTMLGWEDYQRGQVAVVFATLYLTPKTHQKDGWDQVAYASAEEAYALYRKLLDVYYRLCDENPQAYRLIKTRGELDRHWAEWKAAPPFIPEQAPASDDIRAPQARVTHPVGFVLLMEGAEGIRRPQDMEEWWQAGVCLVGPVWAGGRFCGGTLVPGGFTREGYELLEVMQALGMTLDLSHMNEKSCQQALDAFGGTIVATHANARALLKDPPNERHLSDSVIRHLVERDGVMGVIPCNSFLEIGWKTGDDRRRVTLQTLAAHIDHICQIAGDARHAAIGTDFDGGYGFPAVPYELNTISDMQKLVAVLAERGYTEEDINLIMHGNWKRLLSSPANGILPS